MAYAVLGAEKKSRKLVGRPDACSPLKVLLCPCVLFSHGLLAAAHPLVKPDISSMGVGAAVRGALKLPGDRKDVSALG